MHEDFQVSWSEQTPMHSDISLAQRATVSTSAAVKQIVTIRLDIDMLNWYKSAGPGYQTRINQILRDHMSAQRAAEADTDAE